MAADDTLSSARTQRLARRIADRAGDRAENGDRDRIVGRAANPAVLELGFDQSGLAGVRATVRRWAGDRSPAVDDLLLVVNELCGNAIRHGGGRGRLRLWTDGRRILCRVIDRGPGMPEAQSQGLTRPALSTTGGRGLWITRRLAELQIETGPSGTTVTAILPIP